jgi:RNA polymerase sigma-70 factor (ECF subfamily)
VIHAALNAVRGGGKFTSLDDESAEVENLLDRAASVETQVESSQLQHEILSALSKLSPRQRAVIVQRYYLEMSEQEMALALDAAPGTVKWLLNAARGRLRLLLGQKGETDE